MKPGGLERDRSGRDTRQSILVPHLTGCGSKLRTPIPEHADRIYHRDTFGGHPADADIPPEAN